MTYLEIQNLVDTKLHNTYMFESFVNEEDNELIYSSFDYEVVFKFSQLKDLEDNSELLEIDFVNLSNGNIFHPTSLVYDTINISINNFISKTSKKYNKNKQYIYHMNFNLVDRIDNIFISASSEEEFNFKLDRRLDLYKDNNVLDENSNYTSNKQINNSFLNEYDLILDKLKENTITLPPADKEYFNNEDFVFTYELEYKNQTIYIIKTSDLEDSINIFTDLEELNSNFTLIKEKFQNKKTHISPTPTR